MHEERICTSLHLEEIGLKKFQIIHLFIFFFFKLLFCSLLNYIGVRPLCRRLSRTGIQFYICMVSGFDLDDLAHFLPLD